MLMLIYRASLEKIKSNITISVQLWQNLFNVKKNNIDQIKKAALLTTQMWKLTLTKAVLFQHISVVISDESAEFITYFWNNVSTSESFGGSEDLWWKQTLSHSGHESSLLLFVYSHQSSVCACVCLLDQQWDGVWHVFSFSFMRMFLVVCRLKTFCWNRHLSR